MSCVLALMAPGWFEGRPVGRNAKQITFGGPSWQYRILKKSKDYAVESLGVAEMQGFATGC
jgi:hypothetical protein